jgi:hypothetical protein
VSPPATVQVRIVDFGIAKLRESANRVSLGIQGNMGTQRTQSPTAAYEVGV